MVDGGTLSQQFGFVESDNSDGYSHWKYKTTQTRADGSQIVTYSHYAGQTMLRVLKSGGSEWCWFSKYGADAHVALQANPSAISGYDELYADRLHDVGGVYEFLRNDEGFIKTFTYHAPTGYLASESIQEGDLGTPIKLREFEYTHCCASGAFSSSSNSSIPSGESRGEAGTP